MPLNMTETSQHFGINFINYESIYTGPDNEIFLLTSDDGKKYIMRHSLRDKSDQDAHFEQDFSHFLCDSGLPVRLILKTGTDTLLSYCEGQTANIPDITPEMAFNGGKTLALFHQASSKFNRTNILPKRGMTDELIRALDMSEKIIKKYSDGADFIEQICDILSDVPASSVIIHNDFRVQNVLFKDSQISAILDFDWACVGNPLKDLAHAMVEWSYPDGGSFNPDIFKSFFNGYKSISADIDITQLKYWIAFSCLSDTATYLADTIAEPTYSDHILSWMYGKYMFFNSQDITQLTT